MVRAWRLGRTMDENHIQGLNKEVNNLAWSFELMVLENGLMLESDGYRLEVSFDFLMYSDYQNILENVRKHLSTISRYVSTF